MGETLLRTDPRTGAATDAVHGILETHYHRGIIGKAVIVLTIHIIIVFIFVHLETLDLVAIDKIEDLSRADLETATTADTVLLIDIHYEGGRVLFTATG
jgi:hypothetical protein